MNHQDTMIPDASNPLLIDDELDVLADLVPLAGQHIVDLGCGAAQLSVWATNRNMPPLPERK